MSKKSQTLHKKSQAARPNPLSWLKQHRYSAIVLIICIIIFIALYAYANSGAGSPSGDTSSSYTEYETATVLSVVEDDSEPSEAFENKYVGSQTLLVKITSGQYSGSTMSAVNYLGALYGTPLKENDPVVVSVYTSDGSAGTVTIYEYNRTLRMAIILLFFVVVTVLVGGRRGLQSLLGLFLTVICLLFILIPLLMKGFPTILTTFLLCVYVSVTCFILIGGISRKTTCAIIGTIAGIGLAVLFGLLAQSLVKVDGMRMGDYVDALLQLKQGGTPLALSGLLIGGMIISALGAVMDVAMSISSSMQEITEVNPNLSRKQLWKSGMNIGRDMIGTMTNTLILAFVGNSFLLVLYIYSLGVPVYELLSSTLVSTEMVHAIASSIGVILSVPLTVLISIAFYFHKQAATAQQQ